MCVRVVSLNAIKSDLADTIRCDILFLNDSIRKQRFADCGSLIKLQAAAPHTIRSHRLKLKLSCIWRRRYILPCRYIIAQSGARLARLCVNQAI